jgi:hypothetical protein
MKVPALLAAGLSLALSGCVNGPTSVAQADLTLEIGARFSEERRTDLRQLLHEAFDLSSVAEPRLQSFYEVLALLDRSDLGDERVVSIAFVSDDEAVVALHRRNRPVVVHPSRSLRVQRRAGFWVIAPPDHYRPV